eukprot:1574975-Pleurochrysis_carterae.AAC.8
MHAAFDETRNGIVDAKVESLQATNAQARSAASTRQELALFAPDLEVPLLKMTASYSNSFKNKEPVDKGKQRMRERAAEMANAKKLHKHGPAT